MLRSCDDFEVCEPQNLGIVCVRFRPRTDGSGGEPDLDMISRVALERLQLAGDAFVSSTSLNGSFGLVRAS